MYIEYLAKVFELAGKDFHILHCFNYSYIGNMSKDVHVKPMQGSTSIRKKIYSISSMGLIVTDWSIHIFSIDFEEEYLATVPIAV